MQLGNIINKLEKNFKAHKFSGICSDSNEINKGDIFFALKGKKKNGNNFIEDAIKKGAKTIISDNKFEGFKKNILYIYNKNPRKLLSEAASKFYKNKPNNLVAVTGTNGKSSIANFYFQILKLNNVKAASIGTLGINTPKSNFTTDNTTLDPINLNKTLTNLKTKKINNIILEASSHGLKQYRLHGNQFDIGIFTNLSRDHLDYHKTFKNYFDSKMILFNKLMKKNALIIYENNLWFSKKLQNIAKKKKIKTLSIGNDNSNLKIVNQYFFNNKQQISIIFNNIKYSFETKIIGKIQIKNLLMAILAASKIIPMKKIIQSINKIQSVNGRLEKIGVIKNNSKVILDYAHTPQALKICIENIREQFNKSNISILFGCGGERDKPKRMIMGKIANDLCDKIYVTDDNPRSENPKKIRAKIKKKINRSKLIEIPSRDQAIKKAIMDLNSGDVLIVAGKGHENFQEYLGKKLFSDKKCILKHISFKNKKLPDDWKLNILKEEVKNKKLSYSTELKNASINSNKIFKNDIFFGLKGKKTNGSKFANDAIKNGASLAIVDKNYKKKHRKIIKVRKPLSLLTNMSNVVRKTSNINAIAITGSSGKTSLKELLAQTLKKIVSTCYSKNSFNNKYGVPLSLFNINKQNILGVFEIGMDKKGEIQKLAKLVNPDLGIITNISYAHIKNFRNLNEIAQAKSELIDEIVKNGTIVLNRDDHYFNFFKNKAIKRKLKIITFSKKNNANVKYIKTISQKEKSIIILKVYNQNISLQIQKKMEPYIDNLLASVAIISNYFEIKKLNKNIFNNFILPKGRGDIKKIKVKNKYLNIIDESYNSNPLSLEFSIKKFNKINARSNMKYCLLGDMLELGKFSKKLHRESAKYINVSSINKVFVYGKYVRETFNKIKTQKKGKILKNKEEIFKLINEFNNNDYFMIKASNATGLNNVVSKIVKG